MRNKKMYHLETEGYGVQYSPWCHSMVDINLCRSHITHFAMALGVFEILTFKFFYLESLGQDHQEQHSQ